MSVPISRIIRIEGLEICPSLREARLNGVILRIRPKSFDLLLYLVSHADRVVTKQELLAALWKDTQVTENSLVQCVIELRKALDDDARQPRLIQTVAKTGYRWIAAVEEPQPEAVPPPEASPVPPPSVRPIRRWLWLGAVAVALAAVAYLPALPRLFPKAEPHPYEVAWWKLDDSSRREIFDAVGERRATLTNGVSWTTGISGAALAFTGAGTVVRGEDAGGMPRGDSPRTLTAWIKTNSTNADSTAFFQYGNSTPHAATDAFFLMLHDSGRAMFGNYYQPILSRTRVDDGVWHHIAGVFVGGHTRTAEVFVDGMAEAQGTIRGKLDGGWRSDWTIGRGTWGGTGFRGAIDDIRVYERALRPGDLQALYRCTSGAVDLASERFGQFYFISIMGPNAEISSIPGESSAHVRNVEKDFGGVTFVRRVADCPLSSVRAAEVGQDLTIETELRVPPGPAGESTEAGPYFRCRRSSPGDGIIGGTSAGYWVQLLSTGQVRVKRLNPVAVVAFSAIPDQFDSAAFHKLEASINGDVLEVALDGRLVTFDQAGAQVTAVRIPSVWETAASPGTNSGTAGIAFTSEAYTGARIGGQEARNIRLSEYQRLDGTY